MREGSFLREKGVCVCVWGGVGGGGWVLLLEERQTTNRSIASQLPPPYCNSLLGLFGLYPVYPLSLESPPKAHL